jgi:hypothetical protein
MAVFGQRRTLADLKLKLCKQKAHPSLTGLPETHHSIAFWRQQDASARSYVDAAVGYSIKE